MLEFSGAGPHLRLSLASPAPHRLGPTLEVLRCRGAAPKRAGAPKKEAPALPALRARARALPG
eukprot:6857458-Alexandrium_andersonii.AAC.1